MVNGPSLLSFSPWNHQASTVREEEHGVIQRVNGSLPTSKRKEVVPAEKDYRNLLLILPHSHSFFNLIHYSSHKHTQSDFFSLSTDISIVKAASTYLDIQLLNPLLYTLSIPLSLLLSLT